MPSIRLVPTFPVAPLTTTRMSLVYPCSVGANARSPVCFEDERHDERHEDEPER